MENNQTQTMPNTQSNELELDRIDSSFSLYLIKHWSPLLLLLLIAIIYSSYVYHFKGFEYSLVAAFFLVYNIKKRFTGNLYSAFAKANNFEFVKNGVLENMSDDIFSFGDNRKITDMVKGSYQGWPLLLYIYTYTSGSGKNRSTTSETILSIEFNQKLPTFELLDNTRVSRLFNGVADVMIEHYGGQQRLSLEGGFDTHFTTWINPDTQDDVLSILTPDVMELLLGLDKYSIELSNSGTLYAYNNKLITNKQDLKEIYSVIRTIIPKIARHVQMQKQLDEIVPDQTAQVSNTSAII